VATGLGLVLVGSKVLVTSVRERRRLFGRGRQGEREKAGLQLGGKENWVMLFCCCCCSFFKIVPEYNGEHCISKDTYTVFPRLECAPQIERAQE